MKRKNAIILGSISLISLSLVSGILLASNSNLSLIKASAENEYTITLDKTCIQNVTGDTTTKYFDLVGVTGKTGVEYKVEGCTIYNPSSSDFSLGGDHLFTNKFTNSNCALVQIQAYLLDTGTLTDFYMVGKTNGETNKHFYQASWVDGEAGIYEINIDLGYYQLSWLNTIEIDQIVFKYMC